MRVLGTLGLFVAALGYGIAQIGSPVTEVVGWGLLTIGVVMEIAFTMLYLVTCGRRS